jgi:arylsulfatase A-like enzyme
MHRLSRRQFIKSAGAAGVVSAFAPFWLGAKKKQFRKKNILFILADDMGYMDSSLYGSQYYQTPNIDRLAGKGMMFTNAYAASPLCSPTRASIMTGKYPGRLGITTPACHLPPLPKDQPLMPKEAPSDQKMLTPESKRHLLPEEYTIGEAFRDANYKTGFIGKWHLGLNPEYWPREQGFEFDLGAPHPGPPSYFSPYHIETIPDGPQGEYITDRLTDETLAYLEKHQNEPFMLCLWHFAVHAPFQSKEELTRSYRDKTDPRGVQGCAVMASMLQSLDQSIGRITAKLDELKLADNTIIVFVSDNGGNMYDEVEGRPPTHNAPLRGGKGNGYEGGCRVPCMVVWPGVVKPGSKCEEVISTVDFYPTLLAIAGIAPKPKQILDGVSVVPLLKGRSKLSREAIFCHFPHYIPATQNLPCTWVRKGDWKLIRRYGEGPGRSNGYELYNLKEDIGEKTNLADQYPQKVIELDKLIDGFLANTGALTPQPNPAYQAELKCWQGSNDSRVFYQDGKLILTATGNDPFIFTYDVPLVSNPMRLKFKLRSEIQGSGFFFYADDRATGFSPDKKIAFETNSDGQWREYTMDFLPEGQLKGLRLDPGNAAGRAELEWISLERKYGEVLRKWDFSKAV